MIRGIGCDLIEIARIRASIDRHGALFLNRLFTEREQEYCRRFHDPVPHFAGRFAAKEAVSKALGVGFGKLLSWQDFEILSDAKGKPLVSLLPSIAPSFAQGILWVSMSHCRLFAMATALWEYTERASKGKSSAPNHTRRVVPSGK
jgi:holo-[acyl-carrier protein] synthase